MIIGNTLTGEMSRAAALRTRWPYVRRVLRAALAAGAVLAGPACRGDRARGGRVPRAVPGDRRRHPGRQPARGDRRPDLRALRLPRRWARGGRGPFLLAARHRGGLLGPGFRGPRRGHRRGRGHQPRPVRTGRAGRDRRPGHGRDAGFRRAADRVPAGRGVRAHRADAGGRGQVRRGAGVRRDRRLGGVLGREPGPDQTGFGEPPARPAARLPPGARGPGGRPADRGRRNRDRLG